MQLRKNKPNIYIYMIHLFSHCDPATHLKGTRTEQPCPPGTYNPNPRGGSPSSCVPCEGGKYCNSSGASTVTGDCAAGYYCPASASISDPRPTGYECPAGHYCPPGRASPIGCDAGMLGNHQLSKFLIVSIYISKDRNRI